MLRLRQFAEKFACIWLARALWYPQHVVGTFDSMECNSSVWMCVSRTNFGVRGKSQSGFWQGHPNCGMAHEGVQAGGPCVSAPSNIDYSQTRKHPSKRCKVGTQYGVVTGQKLSSM